jgi:PAS domain-containing protein
VKGAFETWQIPCPIWCGPLPLKAESSILTGGLKSSKGFEKQPDGEWDWSGMVHPDDLDATMAALAHAITSSRVHEFEHRLLLRDGTYKWFLSRGTPVCGSDGQVTKWYGTSTDIDRQKMAEAELAKSNARLRLALDSAQMGVWEQDLKTNHVTGDNTISELFGAPNFRGEERDFYELIDRGTALQPKILSERPLRAAASTPLSFRSPDWMEPSAG